MCDIEDPILFYSNVKWNPMVASVGSADLKGKGSKRAAGAQAFAQITRGEHILPQQCVI